VYSEEEDSQVLEWEVEEILDASTIEGQLHFMVLWKGHLLEDCTWEAEPNLANARDAIGDFYAAFPQKTRGLGVPRSKKSAVKK
jgi:Chromo (CHRromatin Organisation MOdifier) domain